MKRVYPLLVYALIFLGFLQTLSVVNGNWFLFVLSKSTGASPNNAAFNALNGVEFWALDHKAEVTTDKNTYVVPITSKLVRELDYPYFVRIIYAFPFAFNQSMPEKLCRDVIKKYLCVDQKFIKSLGVPLSEKVLKIKLISQEKVETKKTFELSEVCGD